MGDSARGAGSNPAGSTIKALRRIAAKPDSVNLHRVVALLCKAMADLLERK